MDAGGGDSALLQSLQLDAPEEFLLALLAYGAQADVCNSQAASALSLAVKSRKMETCLALVQKLEPVALSKKLAGGKSTAFELAAAVRCLQASWSSAT